MFLASLLAAAALIQGTAAPPVLEFPEPGLDDPATYRDYHTRFFRDAHGNALQIYLRLDEGRVVHLWANAANESIGFTARDSAGRPAPLGWGAGGAVAERAREGGGHALTYRLRLGAGPVTLGWFLLGSMRVERDFQYGGGHRRPFEAAPFRVAELARLVANVERLDPEERRRHLAALGASRLETLRGRLDPSVALDAGDTAWVIRVAQVSLDGRNRLGLELTIPRRAADVALGERTASIRPRGAAPVEATVRVTTDAAALTPLGRERMFNAAFTAYAERVRAAGDRTRARRLERQIRGLELVSYEEKLMAGLPNFATYFGRDMMVTALLMEPIWADAMLEHVLASVLRKLSPTGQVSHEEALGGQAIREHAAEYNALVEEYFRSGADTLLVRARALLSDLQAVRENYQMVDDEFQLPVIAARYLGSPGVPAGRKHAFLTDTAVSHTAEPALALLLRNLALVADLAAPYADDPAATNLVGFPRREDGRWHSGSWRDSGPGYADGRFAMDVNVVWVPEALRAVGRILAVLRELKLDRGDMPGARLAAWARDSAGLARAVDAWRGTARHFLVRLGPDQVARRIEAKLAWLPEPERAHWRSVWGRGGTPADTLEFLALSLDARGRPIAVMNSDPALRLLLQDLSGDEIRRALRPFVLPYPTGLLVPDLGPLVANDAYASPAVWEPWRTDLYHSPRVVWGREVNVLLMALGRLAPDPLRDEALRRTRAAVQASGLAHAELWSYRIEDGRLVPLRYGTSSDVQLWNLTDLAVQFVLDQR